MVKVSFLLIVSAILGLEIGLKCRVLAIGLLAPVLAIVVAIAVREFGFVAAALITFACITASQIGYLAGAWLLFRDPKSSSSSEQLVDSNVRNPQSLVGGEEKHQRKPNLS